MKNTLADETETKYEVTKEILYDVDESKQKKMHCFLKMKGEKNYTM